MRRHEGSEMKHDNVHSAFTLHVDPDKFAIELHQGWHAERERNDGTTRVVRMDGFDVPLHENRIHLLVTMFDAFLRQCLCPPGPPKS